MAQLWIRPALLIAGAKIQLTNVDLGISNVATSNDAGYFRIDSIPAGRYRLEITLRSPPRSPRMIGVGHVGFIHEVVREKCLCGHAHPTAIECYFCGPPLMIKACTRILEAARSSMTSSNYVYVAVPQRRLQLVFGSACKTESPPFVKIGSKGRTSFTPERIGINAGR
jgi:hypothetical protein